MAKIFNFKRFTCLVMVFCMLFVYAPNISFASMTMRESYSYTMTVKVKDVKYAGTDSGIYLKVYFNSGKATFSEKMNTKNHNDFERNSKKGYTFSIDAQPWEISHVEIYNSGGDEIYVDYFEFSLPDGRVITQSVNAKFEKSGKKYDVSSKTKRKISSAGNIDSFGGTKYYTKNQTGAQDIAINWNC
ncbi:MAG: PLAT/LH2 domain-containing protein, partial [Hominilimicola sp.]